MKSIGSNTSNSYWETQGRGVAHQGQLRTGPGEVGQCPRIPASIMMREERGRGKIYSLFGAKNPAISTRRKTVWDNRKLARTVESGLLQGRRLRPKKAVQRRRRVSKKKGPGKVKTRSILRSKSEWASVAGDVNSARQPGLNQFCLKRLGKEEGRTKGKAVPSTECAQASARQILGSV